MKAKKQLLDCFEIAISFLQSYMAVKILLPSGKSELIVFEREAFLEKMAYYEMNYDDDLKLIKNPEVSIIDFCCAMDLQNIEMEMFGE